MQDMYPNLPGVLAQFKDGGLVLRNQPTTQATESILLLGTAVDGPTLEPVAVDASTVEVLFGKSRNDNGTLNGATLVKAFEQAYSAGCRDVRVMRISGEKAKKALQMEGVEFKNNVPNEETIEENGNDGQEIQLSVLAGETFKEVDLIKVENATILASNFSFNVSGKVTFNNGVALSGQEIFIEYTVTIAGVDTEKTQTVTFNKEYELEHAPITGEQVFVFVGENEVTGFTIDGTTLTIPNGVTALGDEIIVNYYYEETLEQEDVYLNIEAIYAGEIYNQVSVRVVDITNEDGDDIGKAFEISKPPSKKSQISEEDLSYSSLDYPTVYELVNAVNSDARNNVVRVSVARDYENQATGEFLKETTTDQSLSGGNNGVNLSKQQMFEALSGRRSSVNNLLLKQGAYQFIENYKVDMVVPVGVYANDNEDFAYELALACAVMSHRTNSTMGIIATSSPTEAGLKAVDSHVNSLLGTSFDLNMKDRSGQDIKDTDGNTIDLGRYISILAGPDVTFASGRFGVYGENSAALYAGMISSLAPQSAPTNKNVPSAMGLRYTYSNAQLNALTGSRYVTFKFKSNNAVAVTDAMTAAQPSSDYRLLSTYRVVKTAANEVRTVCEPFIGEPNEVAQRNSMSAALDKRLGKLKEAGILVDYSFQIVVTPIMQILGQAQIELTLIPPMELRQITTVISLQPSGA